MRICYLVVEPIVLIIRTWVLIVTEVIRWVCEWVTSVITTGREVCEEVCGWLGPFSWLCDWICKLVEVIETVTRWICHEVIDRILRWVEIFIEYVIYLLHLVCWLIEWPFRLIAPPSRQASYESRLISSDLPPICSASRL